MGLTVDELLEEAKKLENKAPNKDEGIVADDDFEKIAQTLDSYSKVNCYEQVLDEALDATRKEMEKVASFIKTASRDGYSQDEIANFLEKTAKGKLLGRLLPNFMGLGRGGKLGRRAYLQAEKATKVKARRAAERRVKDIATRAGKKGQNFNPKKTYQKIYDYELKQAKAFKGKPKRRPSYKTSDKRGLIGHALKKGRPYAIGAGLGTGVYVYRKKRNKENTTAGENYQPQVSYGY